MRKEAVGRVVARTNMGYLVVALDKKDRIPRLGFKAYIGDEEVGIVSDIIGNVAKPYVVVKVRDKSLVERVEEGARVYVVTPPPRRARRMRSREGWRRGRRSGRRGKV